MDDGVVEINLSKGKIALISSDDYESVAQWPWHFDGRYARGYPHGVKEYLHRFIMKPKGDKVVDHINGDKLDCRRKNMRNCSRSINASNQTGRARNKHGYRGVTKLPHGKFRAEIYYLGKRYLLGNYLTAIAASAAYEKAKIKLHNGKTIL